MPPQALNGGHRVHRFGIFSAGFWPYFGPPFTCYIFVSPFRKNMWSAHTDTEVETCILQVPRVTSLVSISDETLEF